MDNKLNLYQKIAKVKGEMAKAKLPKTGYNGYTKFNYFQLDDFEPVLEKLCSDYGIVTFFNFSPDSASMTVVDSDNPDQSISVVSPVSITGKTGNAMQDIGAMQTYARRYMFMSFFGITESDTLDAVLGKDEPPKANAKVNEGVDAQPVHTSDNRQSTVKKDDSEILTTWRKVLKSFGYDTKKAKESDTNYNALFQAKNLISKRYGKDNVIDLSKEQVADLDAYISNANTPENFVSDEMPA